VVVSENRKRSSADARLESPAKGVVGGAVTVGEVK
jgi:hypothetical protein